MSLIYEKKGKIAYITLNRPEVMNAMDPEMYQALSEAWLDVRDDPDVWCAIITGRRRSGLHCRRRPKENHPPGAREVALLADPG